MKNKIAEINMSTDGKSTQGKVEGEMPQLLELYEKITLTLNKAIPTESLKLAFEKGLTSEKEDEDEDEMDELEKIVRNYFNL